MAQFEEFFEVAQLEEFIEVAVEELTEVTQFEE